MSTKAHGTNRHLKKSFLTQSPCWFLVLAEAQVPSREPADVPQYVCGLKLDPNAEIGPKGNLETVSSVNYIGTDFYNP